jgi:O-antigen/teichoic acid export membrane protein
LGGRALSLIAFVYIARIVGADRFGTLEFAVAALAYFLLLGDCGLEVWAVRAVAVGKPIPPLVTQITALRLVLSVLSYALLAVAMPLMPDYSGLSIILLLFGVALFPQALNLKWVFVGREQMRKAATGLLVAQLVFAAMMIGLIQTPEHMIWAPVARVASETASAIYFGALYLREFGVSELRLPSRESIAILQPALAVGAVQGIGLLSYNFDALMLGFLRNSVDVGLYSAAYKPVTIALALPLACFTALFPGLSRAYAQSKEELLAAVRRSQQLMLVMALPVGIGGTFLAEPIIVTLFGVEYRPAAQTLKILCWSVVLVTIRGSFKHALTAAGQFGADLRSSSIAITFNIGLNLVLIPRWGAPGAAVATIVSDCIWLALAAWYFNRSIGRVRLSGIIAGPAAGAAVMALCLILTSALGALERGVLGLIAYGLTIALLLAHFGELNSRRNAIIAAKTRPFEL